MKSLCLITFILLLVHWPIVVANDTGNASNTNAAYEYNIETLLNEFAQNNNTTIIIAPSTNASIKLYGKSSDEINEADLHAILHVHGLAMIKSGALYIVKPTEFAKQNTMDVVKSDDSSQQSGAHASQLITTVITLKHIQAAELIPVLQPLISANSHLAAHAPGNTLVLTDTQENTQRITDIITKMDLP